MRRVIAVMSLMAVANLVFAQAGLACPLASVGHTEVASAGATSHEGHDMSLGASHHQESEPTKETGCLTMSPCLVAIDVASSESASAGSTHPDRILAGSDRRPSSLTATPELPPPRA